MDDATFVTKLTPNDYVRQGEYLLSSLDRHVDSEVLAFIEEGEEPEFTEQELQQFGETADLVYGARDFDLDFGPLYQLQALEEMVSEVDTEWIVSLDTDLLFVDAFDLELPEGTEVAARVMDLGNKYWGWEESRGQWKQLHDRYGIPMPEDGVTTLADDYHTVHPLYCTGVVALRRSIAEEFVSRWKEMTQELYHDLPDVFDTFNHWFTEVVAFDILSCDYETHDLSPDYNFNINTAFYAPASCRVLHYHEFNRFWTPMHPSVWREVSRSGVLDETSPLGIIPSLYTPTQIKLRSAWKKHVLRK